MRSIGLIRVFLIAILLSVALNSSLYAGDHGNWNSIGKVLNRPVEVHYGYSGGRFVLITTEVIVSFDKDHIYTAFSNDKHDKSFVMAIVLKRKVLPRILSLGLLSKDRVIYSNPDYPISVATAQIPNGRKDFCRLCPSGNDS